MGTGTTIRAAPGRREQPTRRTAPTARPVLVRVGPDREHERPVLVVVRQHRDREDRVREVVDGPAADLMAAAVALARRHRMVAVGRGVWVARPPHADDDPEPASPLITLS